MVSYTIQPAAGRHATTYKVATPYRPMTGAHAWPGANTCLMDYLRVVFGIRAGGSITTFNLIPANIRPLMRINYIAYIKYYSEDSTRNHISWYKWDDMALPMLLSEIICLYGDVHWYSPDTSDEEGEEQAGTPRNAKRTPERSPTRSEEEASRQALFGTLPNLLPTYEPKELVPVAVPSTTPLEYRQSVTAEAEGYSEPMVALAVNAVKASKYHAGNYVMGNLARYKTQVDMDMETVWSKTNELQAHNKTMQQKIDVLEENAVLRDELDKLTGMRLDKIEKNIRKLQTDPTGNSTTVGAEVQALVNKLDTLQKELDAIKVSGVSSTVTNLSITKPIPPPKFSGPKDTTTSKEWIQKMGMFFADTKVTLDEDKVRQALQRLTGEAYQYMSPVVDKIAAGQTSGHTWATFLETIEKVYGKKTDKEIAEKEIEGYYGDEGKSKIKDDFFNWAQKLRTLARLAEVDNNTLVSQIKRILPEKVRETLATLESVPNYTVPTNWEEYLDVAIDLFKRQYPDKLKGKIFEEEKKKKDASGAAKPADKATKSKADKPTDKPKQTPKPAGTGNRTTDCRKHPGEHMWKDCPSNPYKASKAAASGSGKTKPSGSSSGSQTSGPKKLDPKKKYKVHVVTTQELVTDDEDEDPKKATVGVLESTSPWVLEEVVPLAPTTRVAEEEESSVGSTAKRATEVQDRIHTVPAPVPAGDSAKLRMPWLKQRIADSATALGIHAGTSKDFLIERM